MKTHSFIMVMLFAVLIALMVVLITNPVPVKAMVLLSLNPTMPHVAVIESNRNEIFAPAQTERSQVVSPHVLFSYSLATSSPDAERSVLLAEIAELQKELKALTK